MPPKKQVTKEDILRGALALFRESGMEAINARRLAKMLGCSTQPIYLSFASMEALNGALHTRLWAIYADFLQKEMKRGELPPYKASGMGYIRFAKREPMIFRHLFMRPRTESELHDGEAHFEQIVALVQQQLGLSHEDAARFHMEQWAFVHGIATMQATSYLPFGEEMISAMLTELYLGLKTQYQRGEATE